MNVITLKPHRYKNKQKVKGDKYEFKGTKQELRLALALWVKPYEEKAADVAPPVVAEKSPAVVLNVPESAEKADSQAFENGEKEAEEYANSATVEEVQSVEVAIPEEPSNVVVDVTYKPRRTYKRRDMVSDE